jgi:putative transposase
MPWRECRKVDERLRFVARLLEGEKMAALCREFDVSRKTGYKIFSRYKRCGLEGLADRSRRPYRPSTRRNRECERLITRTGQAPARKGRARRRCWSNERASATTCGRANMRNSRCQSASHH